nr:copia protein [Tanacetum cinerariifolium]
ICLGVDLEPDEWIKDSGCSRHMTGNRKLFFTYKAYNGGKQAHASHKAKNVVSTTRCLELLHIDLFGPSAMQSYAENRYTLVIVDDYSREFDNEVQFGEFCNANGITHNFSAPRTPQSNGVVERKNRTLQEIGYSQNSKAYIVLNKHTKKVKESLNVTFNETPPLSKTSPLVDDDLDEEEAIKVIKEKNLENDIVDETLEIDEIVNIKKSRNHPLENVIGNLNQRTLRPDIMFSVCLCARFQEAPKTSHLEAVKRIFRYIKGTTHLGLWYPKGTGIETVVYADSDHASDYVDRKSTSSICTFVGCCLTSWFSKKQTALGISTTEAEYVSAKKACQQALWMKQALIDYDV